MDSGRFRRDAGRRKLCDARELGSCKEVLIALVRHAMARRTTPKTPMASQDA